MVKAMRRRDVERALREHDCTGPKHGKRHDRWFCPCGQHTADIPRHTVISPGVIDDTVKRMACLPKGWLQ